MVERWTFNLKALGSSPSVLNMNDIEIHFYSVTAAIILFHIGMLGLILNRGNILKIIMSLELALLAINLNLISFSTYLDDITGQIFVLFILTLSATESSIGLSILAAYYQHRTNVELDPIKIRNKNIKF